MACDTSLKRRPEPRIHRVFDLEALSDSQSIFWVWRG